MENSTPSRSRPQNNKTTGGFRCFGHGSKEWRHWCFRMPNTVLQSSSLSDYTHPCDTALNNNSYHKPEGKIQELEVLSPLGLRYSKLNPLCCLCICSSEMLSEVYSCVRTFRKKNVDPILNDQTATDGLCLEDGNWWPTTNLRYVTQLKSQVPNRCNRQCKKKSRVSQ